jgi:hypothetical protein
MKLLKMMPLVLVMFLVISAFTACSDVTGKLDDQSPVLIVKITTTGAITIDKTHQVFLIYYINNNWTNPWLIHGSHNHLLINPVVGAFSIYVAAFWDANGNGILDAGDPCTGYVNATHTPLVNLTPLNFLPLEWRVITINLNAANTF